MYVSVVVLQIVQYRSDISHVFPKLRTYFESVNVGKVHRKAECTHFAGSFKQSAIVPMAFKFNYSPYSFGSCGGVGRD